MFVIYTESKYYYLIDTVAGYLPTLNSSNFSKSQEILFYLLNVVIVCFVFIKLLITSFRNNLYIFKRLKVHILNLI